MPERFVPHIIQAEVETNIDRLFAPWQAGRPPNYSCDKATKQLVSLSYWLDEELRRLGCDDVDRKTQLGKYHRLSRTYDIWLVATECLNDVIDGLVEQNRVPHRRWG